MEIMKGMVSVIIPVYNRVDTIENCIYSILQQTYKNIEIIIVDDGSGEDVGNVVNKIASKKITFYRYEKNRGACYARNYGAERAQGEYIAFQDSDDLWVSDKLEKQLKFMEESNFDFVFCGMNRYDENQRKRYYPGIRLNDEKVLYRNLLGGNCISTQTMLMKREVFQKIRFDDSIRRYQDWDFALRVSQNFSIGYLKEALVNSTIQNNSISKVVSSYDSLLVIYEKYKKDIESDKEINAKFQALLGAAVNRQDIKKGIQHYKKSLSNKFHYKTFAKYCLCCIGIKR